LGCWLKLWKAPVLRWFARNQPMTPIIETMRSILTNGTIGNKAAIAIAWCAGLPIAAYVLALRVYKAKSV
jgi:ABC-2 type transport system permease protein